MPTGWHLSTQRCRCGLYRFGSQQCLLVGTCQHSGELSGSTQDGEIPDQLTECLFIKMNCAACSNMNTADDFVQTAITFVTCDVSLPLGFESRTEYWRAWTAVGCYAAIGAIRSTAHSPALMWDSLD